MADRAIWVKNNLVENLVFTRSEGSDFNLASKPGDTIKPGDNPIIGNIAEPLVTSTNHWGWLYFTAASSGTVYTIYMLVDSKTRDNDVCWIKPCGCTKIEGDNFYFTIAPI